MVPGTITSSDLSVMPSSPHKFNQTNAPLKDSRSSGKLKYSKELRWSVGVLMVFVLYIFIMLTINKFNPAITISITRPQRTILEFTVTNNSNKYIHSMDIEYKGKDANGNWYYSGNVRVGRLDKGETRTATDIFVLRDCPQIVSIRSCIANSPDLTGQGNQLSFEVK
jgi:hypothetical protein